MKLGINGFGRIGRQVLGQLLRRGAEGPKRGQSGGSPGLFRSGLRVSAFAADVFLPWLSESRCSRVRWRALPWSTRSS